MHATRRLLLPAACLAAAAGLAACASQGGSGGGSSAAAEDSGPAADQRFYEGRCGVCHVPFHPYDYTTRKWPSILAEMAPKAGLSPAQRERVLRYVLAGAADAPAPAAR